MQALEKELRRLGLWQASPPSPEALASQMPFCFDTLAFTEWLQWVFIPRTRAVIDHGGPLPEHSGIAPLAEEVFKEMSEDTEALYTLLCRFDRLIEGPA